jgi:amino acid adenylation domain-containing protein
MQLLPKGAIGELYIGGEQVARGYHNNEKLTKECFLPNPFQTIEQKQVNFNDRIYKTGDLVRYLENGDIEYIGRNDNQVKIRGFRIELGEIKSQLLEIDGVQQTVTTVVGEDGSKQLVSYYVSDKELNSSFLMDELSKVLPDYMVPRLYVRINSVPLTVNGKIDYKALSLIDIVNHGREVVLPSNEIERNIWDAFVSVLGLDEDNVSMDDNFFYLGGDSIKAIQLMNYLSKNYSYNLQVKDIFINPSILRLSKLNLKDEKVELEPYHFQSSDEQVLSFAQERLFFIDVYEQGVNAYNIPFVLKLKENISVDRLEDCIRKIIDRHEVLHSVYKQDDEGNIYQVLSDTVFRFTEKIVGNDEDEKQIIDKYISHIFDLSKELPIKGLVIIDETSKEIVLVLNIHHIAFDAWSKNIFMNELSKLYDGEKLPKLLVQYKDYAVWQRNYLKEDILNDQLNYWKESLDGFETLNLPTDYNRSKEIDYAGDSISFILNQSLSMKLKDLSKENNVSLYTLLLAAYYLMLSVYSGQNDIVVGSPIANRHISGTEDIISFFVNTLALRCEIDKNLSFNDFVRYVGDLTSNAQVYQDLPFEKLVDELDIVRDTSRHPIFQTLFQLQTINNSNNNGVGGLFEPYDNDLSFDVSKFDFDFSLTENRDNIIGFVSYASKLFEKETVQGFINTYLKIIEQVINSYDKKLSNLELVDKNTKKELIIDYNNTKTDFEKVDIVSLFERQVVSTPNNVAVVFEDIKLTYVELNEKANKLANYLITGYGVQPDDLVALLLDRSENMIVSILGVLKSGAAYVPISLEYPIERIDYIVKDSGVKMVILNENYEKIINKNIFSINIDDFFTRNKNLNKSKPKTTLRPNNLAYMIYTSGTTGKPKGVMIEHGSVINRIIWMNNEYQIVQSDNVLQKTPYTFDVSVWEFIWPLLYGATLTFAISEGHKDPQYLAKEINKYKITIIHFVPSMLQVFEEIIKSDPILIDNIKSLNHIFCSGEALQVNQIELVYELLPEIKIHNLYGPTEATVDVTYFNCSNNDNLKIIPIGKPIQNTTAYILSSDMQLLPKCAIRELYIGGEQVSRGYHNNEKLTNEYFLPNPFQTIEQKQVNFNDRIYKTGDLVRYLENGNIEYIGRNDNQVKIRGFRIELGEIETRLLEIDGVKQVTVQALDDKNNNKFLAAYYVLDTLTEQQTTLKQKNAEIITQETILEFLGKSLPDYMIPQSFTQLEQLPLTINGKLDTKALPHPDFGTSSEYLPPTTKIEQQVVEAFSQTLEIPANDISITDNFFYLGGDSIKSIRLTNVLINTYNLNLKVSDIFINKTSQNIAKFITKNTDKFIDIKPYSFKRENDQLVSFAQERLWFIDTFEQGTNAYNILMVVKLAMNANINAIKKSIKEIVNRHLVLRSVIKQDEKSQYSKEINQKTSPFIINQKTFINKKDLDEEIKSQIGHIFNLEEDYPIKAELINNTKTNELYLSVVIHHVAFDGWSTNIFIDELSKLYLYYDLLDSKSKNYYLSNNLRKPEYPLQVLKIQYKDFAIWQRGYLKGDTLQKQVEFWKKSLDGFETLNLPTDYPRPKEVSYAGDNVFFEINESITIKLKQLAKDKGISLYTLMLSIYYLLLSAYSNQKNITIGSIIANRHIPKTEDIIGFFVNTLALRIDLSELNTVNDLLNKVNDLTISSQEYQDLPFEKLVEELKIPQDLSRHPIFQVMFILQIFAENHNELSDLFEAYPDVNMSVAKFDLSLFISESIKDDNEVLNCSLNYATKLFNKATIESFANTYIELSKQIADLKQKEGINELDKQISEISYVNIEESKELIETLNNTYVPYPRDKTIVDLFEEQVRKTPGNIAVVFEDVKFSYAELNERANKFANYLIIEYDVQPDDLVGLLLDRSENMIVSILGVLKSGAAYVPISLEYPIERIDYIVKDSGVKVVILNEIYKSKIEITTSCIVIDSNETIKILESQKCTDTKTTLRPNNLAYMIYTSGTTGKPKGVMVEHGSVINRIIWMNNEYQIVQSDNVLQKTPYTFDVSVWEFIWPLLYGATLTFAISEGHKDPQYLAKEINKDKITIIHFVPSMLQVFEEIIKSDSILIDKIKSLNHIFCSGEALQVNQIELAYKLLPEIKIHNLYGPTEATVDVTYFNCSNDDNLKVIPIGKPIQNTTTYILSSDMQLLPKGAIGELYIGGEQVERGYHNNKKLTNEYFLLNPFQTIEQKRVNFNSRIYKTGDLVRYLENGDIEYIGRNDNQVKIRGFRIELGEIESQLLEIDGVQQTVTTVVGEDDSKQLVSYYVSDKELDTSFLMDELSKVLPDYMVPYHYYHLNEIPLNNSGKVDRNKLPEYIITQNEEYVSPQNQLQIELVNLFSNVLGLNKDIISVKDDFFYIGGDSIKSIQLSSQIKSNLNKMVSVKEIFQKRTILNIENLIIKQSKDLNIIKHDKHDLYPLSPNQIDYLNMFDSYINANMNFCVIFNAECYDVYKLKDALIKTIDINSYMKTYAVLKQNMILYQKNNEEYEVNIKVHKKTLTKNIINDYFKEEFNLFKPLLFKFEFYYDDENIFLLIRMHHAIFDFYSLQIILNDLIRVYNGEKFSKSHDYFDYTLDYYENIPKENVLEINKKKISTMFKNKFTNVFKKEPSKINGNFFNKIKDNKRAFSFNAKIDENIMSFYNKYKITENDFIFYILIMALKKFLKSDEISVDYSFNGHNDPKYTDTIGLFVRELKLSFKLKNDSIKSLLKYIKESVYLKIENFDKFNQINAEQNIYIKYNYMVNLVNKTKNNFTIKEIPQNRNEVKINKNILWFYITKNDNNDLLVNLIYNNDYYTNEDIEKLFRYVNNLLKKLFHNSITS